MTTTQKRPPFATIREIREIIGPCDDEVLASILDIGATREEVLEALTWLSSDDYLHHKLHHGLTGRAARVFDIIKAEFPEERRA